MKNSVAFNVRFFQIHDLIETNPGFIFPHNRIFDFFEGTDMEKFVLFLRENQYHQSMRVAGSYKGTDDTLAAIRSEISFNDCEEDISSFRLVFKSLASRSVGEQGEGRYLIAVLCYAHESENYLIEYEVFEKGEREKYLKRIKELGGKH